MNILYGIQAAKNASLQNTVVTAGTFDGVHQGHLLILNRLIDVAKSINGTSVVITYEPHPRQVVDSSEDIRILSTLNEKIELLAKAGIDYLLVLPFTKEFSKLSSTQYIKTVLQDALQTKFLVIGYDHKFGRNREGSFSYLLANEDSLGFEVIEIPRHDIKTIAVSSTKTRNALLEGDLKTANLYLGRYYAITGVVIEGKQLGRTIGFPTANLQPNHDKK
jgi:riboflavin kinase/FMN adenylyltransferase